MSVTRQLQQSIPGQNYPVGSVNKCILESNLPQPRSKPPRQAIVWSTITIFSWCDHMKGIIRQFGCIKRRILGLRPVRYFWVNQESMVRATLGALQMMMLILMPDLAKRPNMTSNLYYSLQSGLLSEKKGEIIQPVIKISFLAASNESHKLQK